MRGGSGNGRMEPRRDRHDDQRVFGETHELIAALLAEIEWLRNELEYLQLLAEVTPPAGTDRAVGVVDAVRGDPSLGEADRDRLIALYRDLVRLRASRSRDRGGG
jgi:hypothetical protein